MFISRIKSSVRSISVAICYFFIRLQIDLCSIHPTISFRCTISHFRMWNHMKFRGTVISWRVPTPDQCKYLFLLENDCLNDYFPLKVSSAEFNIYETNQVVFTSIRVSLHISRSFCLYFKQSIWISLYFQVFQAACQLLPCHLRLAQTFGCGW